MQLYAERPVAVIAEIALSIGFNTVTFWIGVLAAGGAALILLPPGAADVFGEIRERKNNS